MSRLSDDLRDALALFGATTDGIYPPEQQLDRALYLRAKDTFQTLGGRWTRGRFEFPMDPRPVLDALLASGILPERNPTAYFPTPKGEVQEIVEDLNIAGRCALRAEWGEAPLRILDPSAGQGGIADVLREVAPEGMALDLVELLDINVAVLEQKGYEPHMGDFLQFKPSAPYDVIVMNPPFQGKAYINHVEHALSMLAPGGELVAIVPTTLFSGGSKAERRLLRRLLLDVDGRSYDLPAGTFKEAGTMVKTSVIRLSNPTSNWQEQPHLGYPSFYDWQFWLWVNNDGPLDTARHALFADFSAERCRAFAVECLAACAKHRVSVDIDAVDYYARQIEAEYRAWSDEPVETAESAGQGPAFPEVDPGNGQLPLFALAS